MDIDSITAQIEPDIQKVDSAQGLEDFRLKYLGRKGILAELTATIPALGPQQRGELGRQVNALKERINNLIRQKQKTLGSAGDSPKSAAACDISMPGIAQEFGCLHPLTMMIKEICGVFSRMGFSIVEGPQIETEFNNFTGLNIPLEHPSRDAFDTFYLKTNDERVRSEAQPPRRGPTTNDRFLLRSHTSPVQVRVMKQRKPPLSVVVPGRVYRPDAVDASHSFMFHQIEGLLVDRGVRFCDLKGALEVFIKTVFGNSVKTRFRPHFFPFTEPSAEVDISCIICNGSGCSVCGRKGWLEILGCGMVHPNVFKQVGYDPGAYSGFAFGMGIERITMLKYGIDDIRLFFQNDLRFLKQF